MSSFKVVAAGILVLTLASVSQLYAANPGGAGCSYAACQNICSSKGFSGRECSKRCTRIMQKKTESGQCKSVT